MQKKKKKKKNGHSNGPNFEALGSGLSVTRELGGGGGGRWWGRGSGGGKVSYLTSPGLPADIGLQLGKACCPCSR